VIIHYFDVGSWGLNRTGCGLPLDDVVVSRNPEYIDCPACLAAGAVDEPKPRKVVEDVDGMRRPKE
jgi:hypothetical protein